MPTWVKVLLIVVGVGLVMLVAGGIVAGRWIRARGRALASEGQVAQAEGEEFGKGKDAEACMSESLSRLRACDGFICESKQKIFLRHCLETASVAPELCSTIPKQTQFLDSAKWQMAECARRGFPDDQRCMRVVQALQFYCEQRP